MVSSKHAVVSVLLIASAVLVRAGMYSEHVEQLSSSNFDKLVMDSSETWLVKFYAPWCGHCQSSAPAFSKAAKKLRGVARLGVVNCDDDKSISQRFGVQGFPTIKVFKGEGRKARRPSDYNSQRSSQAFVDHVKYVMPSFVARVKPTGADAFFNDLASLPHVLLFTEQSSTSPLYKGMSARFKNRLAFGEVRKSDAKELATKFEVTNFPTLLAFHPGQNDADTLVRFSGAMDPTSLDTFFSNFAQGNATQPEGGADGDGANAKKDASEKVFAQPKAYSGDIVTLSGTKQYEEGCGSRKDGRMCALAFLSNGETNPHFEMLKPIALKYQYDNMAFAVMDGNVAEAQDFANVFGVDATTGFVLIRARKKKYAAISGEVALDESSVTSFLDKVVGGDARWKKVAGDFPEWVVEEPEEETKETKETKEEAEEGDAGGAGQCGGAGETAGAGQCGGAPEPKAEDEDDGGQCGGPPKADAGNAGTCGGP